MPRSSSRPEVALRRRLHASGLRFTIHRRDLPGTPDIVFSRARLAVFVDGCFWHACPLHGVLPRNNREWWAAKLESNRRRDRMKDEALVARGWLPLHFWEHELTDAVASAIVAAWQQRTGRGGC